MSGSADLGLDSPILVQLQANSAYLTFLTLSFIGSTEAWVWEGYTNIIKLQIYQ